MSTATMIDKLPTHSKPSGIRLHWVRDWLVLIVTMATVLQLAINYSLTNLEMSVMLLAGLWIGAQYTFKSKFFTAYPISTLMILGYVVYHFVIPPIGQLSELQSITHILKRPIWVEVYDLTGLIFIILGHVLYRRFSVLGSLREILSTKFYKPLGFFSMPASAEYWLLGAVGIVATIFNTNYKIHTSGGTVSAIFNVLIPLTYIPYLVVNPALANPDSGSRRKTRWLPLVLYTLVVFAVSLVRNSRGFMLTGLVSLILAYIYRILNGDLPVPKISLKSVLVIILALIFVTGPVTNLAASMVIARKDRSEVSKLALIKETWSIYRSGVAVKAYDIATSQGYQSGEYNEAYYNNIFLNRLGNLKFDDLSMQAATGARLLGDIGYFRDVEYKKCLALLPEPIIKALHLDVNKNYITSGSSEDFLYEEATGYPVGGFKLGSLTVLLHATFGLIWPLILAVAAAFAFSLADSLCFIRKSVRDASARDVVILSPFLVVIFFSYVFYFSGGGNFDFPGTLASLTRSWIQVGILYGAVYFVARWFNRSILSAGAKGLR